MTHDRSYHRLISIYQAELNAMASETTKGWWERYMKGVISFRGVGIPKNRELLLRWRKEHRIEQWPLAQQLDLALAFIYEPMAEDKLAGILFLQQFLVDKVPWETVLPRYGQLYDHREIFDWNICDWFCVRVLGPTIQQYGLLCARQIASWKDAAYLWKARTAVVAFVTVAAEPMYYPAIDEACTALIQRNERFAKTCVGWLLRDISKHDTRFVESFLHRHLADFSKESLKNATKHFEKPQQQEYFQKFNVG